MFSAGILNLILAYIVIVRDAKKPLNRLFGSFAAIAGILVLFDFVFRFYPDIYILRTTYALAALVGASGALWVLEICRIKIKTYFKILFLLPGLFFSIAAYIDGFLVKNIHELTFLGYRGELGPLFIVFSVYLAVYLIFFGALLYFTQRQALSTFKLQLRYALFGLVSYGSLGILFSLVLPTFFNNYSFTLLDAPSSILFVAFTAYAITRYRFLDIRIVILRSITFGVIVLTISAAFVALSATLGDILEPIVPIRSDILVGLLVGALVAILYDPMKKFLEAGTARFLYRKRYDPDKLLSEITEITSSVLVLNKLLEAIAKTLGAAFNPSKVAFALLNDKKKLNIAYVQGIDERQAAALAEAGQKVLFKEFQRSEGKTIVLDELVSRYEAGEYQPVDKDLMYALHNIDISLIVPLYLKDNLNGVIALGAKKSGDLYTQSDLNILEIISGQTAIAIENAQLYDELRKFNITLQQRINEATKDLRSANTRMRELDKTKSEFISIASHQLRTPLTVIKGYISMMREGSFGKISPKILDNLEKVYTANERLIGLVENLLDISRIESGRQQFTWDNVRVEDLATTVVEELAKNAKDKGLKLIFAKPKTSTPMILADKNKLHEVIMNFTDNAIKYTKSGKVHVSVTAEPKGYVTFSVKDTGMGIVKESLPYLFQKFSRGKDSFKVHTEGTGLGLFVARMIIEAHHGSLGVETGGPGKGSKFFFEVPLQGPKTKNYKVQEPVTKYLSENNV